MEMFLVTLLVLLEFSCVVTTPVVYVTEEDLPAYVLYNEAVEYSRIGDSASAIGAYLAALKLKRDFPEAHQNIALLYEKSGQDDECRYHHEQSVLHAQSPAFKSSALVNLAGHLLQRRASTDDTKDLESLLFQAVELNPENDNAVVTLSALYTEKMEYERAIHFINLGLLLNPANALALMNKGIYFFRNGAYGEALQWFFRARELSTSLSQEDSALLFNNLGQCFRELGQLSESFESFTIALNHLGTKKGLDSVMWTMSNRLAVQGIASNWRDLEDTEHEILRIVGAMRQQVALNDRKLSRYFLRPARLVDLYTFTLLRYATASDDLLVALSVCNSVSSDQYFSVSQASSFNNKDYELRSPSRVRLGYFSFDWRDHPMGRLTTSLVASHNASNFIVYCFYFGPPDLSSLQKNHHDLNSSTECSTKIGCTNIQKRKYDPSPQWYFRNTCSEFVDLTIFEHDRYMEFNPLSDEMIISKLVSYDLDILVDLTSHTTGGRIEVSGSRPANIVVNYLGFPGTTGCAGFRYNMVDALVLPADTLANHYFEKIVYLPGSYQANDMPISIPTCGCGYGSSFFSGIERPNSSSYSKEGFDDLHCCKQSVIKELIAAGHDPEVVFGQQLLSVFTLRQNLFWVCSFNSNKKMEPVSFSVWMNILRRIPRSILILLSPGSSEIQKNLVNQAMFFGVHSNRIVFMPKILWKLHLWRSSVCDIALDNFVYGAHTTASDLLWQWVPVISLASWGERMPSRVASSISRVLSTPSFRSQVKLDDVTIADSAKSFEDLSLRLLNDFRVLNYVKVHLLGGNTLVSPAFDSFFKEKAVESAYGLMMNMDFLFKNRMIKSYMHIAVRVNYDRIGIWKPTDDLDSLKPACTGESAHILEIINMVVVQFEKWGFSETLFLAGQNDRHLVMSMAHRALPLVISLERHVLPLFRRFNVVECMDSLSENRLSKFKLLQNAIYGILLWGEDRSLIHDPNNLLNISSKLKRSLVNDNNASAYSGDTKNSPINCSGLIDVRRYYNCAEQHIKPYLNTLRFDAASLRNCMIGEVYSCLSDVCSSKVFVQHLLLEFRNILKSVVAVQTELAENHCDHERIFFSVSSPIFLTDSIGLGPRTWKTSYENASAHPAEARILLDYLGGVLFPGQHSLLFEKRNLCNSTNMKGDNVSDDMIENWHEGLLSVFLYTHATCLLEASDGKRNVGAVRILASALLLDVTSPFMQLMLGVAIQQANDPNLGFLVSSLGVRNQNRKDRMNSGHVATVAINGTGGHSNKKIRIVIYCNEYGNTWWPNWGPNSMHSGAVGGSEEAAIMISENLASLGYQVEVYADSLPSETGKIHRGVLWFNFRDYDADNPPDVFVAWRYALSIGGLCPETSITLCVLWLHDIVPASAIPPVLVYRDIPSQTLRRNFMVIVPSHFHFVHLPFHLQRVAKVLSNGLTDENFVDRAPRTCNNGNIFIYASAPNRGLEGVLKHWTYLKTAIPDAILKVFYGFSASRQHQLKRMMGLSDIAFSKWQSEIELGLTQEGVHYVGEVSPQTLLDELASAGFLLYPTTFPEVGCITVMKAMSVGCIPITSRYVNSVLYSNIREIKAVTGNFDLGPNVPYQDLMNYTMWMTEHWVPSVIFAYRRNFCNNATDNYELASTNKPPSCFDCLSTHRFEMKSYARKTFSWKKSALELIELLYPENRSNYGETTLV